MGVNLFAEPYGMPAGIDEYIASKGMYTIGDGNAAMAASKTTDEPDWRGCQEIGGEWPAEIGPCRNIWGDGGGPLAPDALQEWADHVRSQDPTRPLYNQYTKAERAGLGEYSQITGRPECEDYNVNVENARAYLASADIISYDWYLLQSGWTPENCRMVWFQGDAVRNARQLSDFAKPVWPFIGVTKIDDGNYTPTNEDLNAEVWTSIVAGARGIQYFQHNFSSQGTTSRALIDPRYTALRDQIAATNARVASLAPVINAPYADGLTTVAAGQVDVMSKGYDGAFYIFVTSRQKAGQTATFDVAGLGNGTVEVLDEGRTITATGGRFSDEFASQNAVHIYRFVPTA
jgi:hypothetical protein